MDYNCRAGQIIKNNGRLGPIEPWGGKVGIDRRLFLMTWPALSLPEIMSMQEN